MSFLIRTPVYQLIYSWHKYKIECHLKKIGKIKDQRYAPVITHKICIMKCSKPQLLIYSLISQQL